MKKIFFAIAVLSCGMISCTSKDCHCTYYDENGVEVPSYSYDYEEMEISSCSDLDSYVPGEQKGFLCE